MRRRYAAAVLGVILIVGAKEYAQQPTAPGAGGPAYLDPANWGSVHPTETDNIVYATVPHIPNPSAEASPNPGTPNGIRTPVPNTGPAGTLDMHLDVYQVPSSKPTPVVIQLHGGGWIRGDRPSSSRSFAGFFAAGMSVVTVQYRNAIDAPAPAAIQDVRCAMAWVKRNAAKYNFDPNRIIPWGGSAGGHLALMAGYAPASFNPPGCTDQPKVVAVFDMYGDTNLVEALTQHGGSASVHQWLGMDLPLPRENTAQAPKPAQPAKTAASTAADYDDTAPVQPPPGQAPRWPEPTAAMLARAREVSPMTYVSPHVPPTFIINGDSDHSVDPAQSVELQKALEAAGVPNIHYVVVGGGHGNFPPAENTKGMLLALHFFKDHGIIQWRRLGCPDHLDPERMRADIEVHSLDIGSPRGAVSGGVMGALVYVLEPSPAAYKHIALHERPRRFIDAKARSMLITNRASRYYEDQLQNFALSNSGATRGFRDTVTVN